MSSSPAKFLKKSVYVALVGSPNSGKTSLFNALTGSRQKVANYPGVTVEKKEGHLHTPHGHSIKILDLPGTYSLDANTLDEAVTRDVLLANHFENSPPDLVLAVVDATNLKRGLNLVLELRELNLPVIVALNMMDLAYRRGLHLDLRKLEKELGMPVLPVVAVKHHGLMDLLDRIDAELQKPLGSFQEGPALAPPISEEDLYREFPTPTPDQVRNRFKEIDRVLNSAQVTGLKPAYWTDRLDHWILHPIWGSVGLFLVLLFVFQGIFNWAQYPMDGIDQGVSWVEGLVRNAIPVGWLQSFLADGVIAGVGSVVVFLPQILLLFFFIMILEDSGYMARAAFLMDRHMSRVGLHGRAFIPLLSSFACAIPGIMSTRTIENKRDRLITILIAPLMACSARVPVYTLLISAFIPNKTLWGPFKLQGLVMMGLYALGVVVALLVALVLRKLLSRGPNPLFLLELPTYKWPNLRNVLIGMWERSRLFLKRAGTVILAASIIIWFLSSYPKKPSDAPKNISPIQYSLAGRLGNFLEPAVRPIGFDGSIAVGLVTGIVAREVIVGSLATYYSIEGQEQGESNQVLSEVIKQRWSIATGLSLLIFFVFAMQCLSTLAVVRRETNSWKIPLFMLVYMTGLAYGAAAITYHLTRALS